MTTRFAAVLFSLALAAPFMVAGAPQAPATDALATVYNTRELNQMGRLDQKTGVRANVAPARPPGQPRLRYNWIAPIALSPHNPAIVYGVKTEALIIPNCANNSLQVIGIKRRNLN